MKKNLCLLLAVGLLMNANHVQAQSIFKKLKDKVVDKTNQKVDDKTDQAASTVVNAPENAVKGNGNSSANNGSTNTANAGNTTNNDGNQTSAASFKTYANYDFVPGDKIIFEDNFSEDQDGEFPSHWDLIQGQAILNKLKGEESFYLTDGNYVRVAPLMKNKKYLSTQFTIEFDTYPTEGAYGIRLHLNDAEKHELVKIATSSGDVSCEAADKSLSGSFHEESAGSKYFNKWHHYAVAFKNGQIKIYCDATRVLVMPNSNVQPETIEFAGIGSVENPMIIKNIRVAEGGGMNMLGKKFTDAKIITHGINFDVNKSVIKPESMGTLNSIVKIMQDNPEIKFQVGGHTDSDGDDASNMTLSQRRADAVMAQLISMGIDATRLTAKGFGETKPIADNTTFEGKANNRRVEFVKM